MGWEMMIKNTHHPERKKMVEKIKKSAQTKDAVRLVIPFFHQHTYKNIARKYRFR